MKIDDILATSTEVSYLAVYTHDRAYGGPEEGGWWYGVHTWEPEFKVQMFTDEGEACAARKEWQAVLDEGPNDGRPPVSSVLSEGVLVAMVTDHPPCNLPRETPRFE